MLYFYAVFLIVHRDKETKNLLDRGLLIYLGVLAAGLNKV